MLNVEVKPQHFDLFASRKGTSSICRSVLHSFPLYELGSLRHKAIYIRAVPDLFSLTFEPRKLSMSDILPSCVLWNNATVKTRQALNLC